MARVKKSIAVDEDISAVSAQANFVIAKATVSQPNDILRSDFSI